MFEVTQENNFDFSSDEYASVFEQSRASAFQSPNWLASFYNKLVPADGTLPVITTFRREGKLMGIVPMIRRRKSGLRLLEACDLGVSDYAAPVLAKEVLHACETDCDLREKFQNTLATYDVLRIRPVRPEHVCCWQSLFGEEPHSLEFSAHSVTLTAPFDDWRKQHLDSKLAGMVARKGKRWKKQHDVVLERVENPANAKLAIANLAKMRAGRFEGDPIQSASVREFYELVAANGTRDGSCETWMLTSDGAIAGILFGLCHKGRFVYLLIGADYDAQGRHSPGMQMYDWIIEDWMTRGGTSFDFTIGDEPFKQQFGTKASSMSMFLSGNSFKGNLALTLFGNRLKR